MVAAIVICELVMLNKLVHSLQLNDGMCNHVDSCAQIHMDLCESISQITVQIHANPCQSMSHGFT